MRTTEALAIVHTVLGMNKCFDGAHCILIVSSSVAECRTVTRCPCQQNLDGYKSTPCPKRFPFFFFAIAFGETNAKGNVLVIVITDMTNVDIVSRPVVHLQWPAGIKVSRCMLFTFPLCKPPDTLRLLLDRAGFTLSTAQGQVPQYTPFPASPAVVGDLGTAVGKRCLCLVVLSLCCFLWHCIVASAFYACGGEAFKGEL